MSTPNTETNQRRTWLRRAAAGGFVLVATLVLLELALRFLGLAQPVLYEEDAAAGYRLKPNQRVSYAGVTVDVNNGGIRDTRSTDALLAHSSPTLVLGDSVTWGGVRMPHEALFTSRLEAALGTTVVNAGVNGYSVAQMTALYRTHLSQLKPGLVVVYVIPGDFLRPPNSSLVRNSVAFPLRRPWFATTQALAIARLMAHSRFGWEWIAPPPVTEPVEQLDETGRVERNVDALVGLAREVGKERVLVVVSPFMEREENPPLPETVRQTLDAEGIALLELSEVIPPAPRLFVDHIHLSAEGHEAVAGALVARLAVPAE
ncbi:MAG: hypothetical protein GY851_23180 [bacterium]|nr:hypothetical protein [bacterium]